MVEGVINDWSVEEKFDKGGSRGCGMCEKVCPRNYVGEGKWDKEIRKSGDEGWGCECKIAFGEREGENQVEGVLTRDTTNDVR